MRDDPSIRTLAQSEKCDQNPMDDGNEHEPDGGVRGLLWRSAASSPPGKSLVQDTPPALTERLQFVLKLPFENLALNRRGSKQLFTRVFQCENFPVPS